MVLVSLPLKIWRETKGVTSQNSKSFVRLPLKISFLLVSREGLGGRMGVGKNINIRSKVQKYLENLFFSNDEEKHKFDELSLKLK